MMAVPPFVSVITDSSLAETGDIGTLQINLGRMCNLSCKHCHLGAGPKRREMMTGDAVDACLELLRKHAFETVDITGGSPEMHPAFKRLVSAARPLCENLIVRSNLTLLLEPGYDDLPEFFARLSVEICASLPHYTKTVDKTRGDNVFARSIAALLKLNSLGYGRGCLSLNLVFNPGGAFLPPSQASLEREYRDVLKRDYGVVFDGLLTITNNPLGRFGDFLERSGNMESYMEKLYNAFNPATLPGMMCRSQISVGPDGSLYDCDFNQAAELPIAGATIFNADSALDPRKIRFGQHCYACTAGQGSSCGGAIKT
ncbi:radical SAM/Cys-rich domain protein [Synergistales bacterium]|nr:radical SAM/Cys-rich domain protein [Synergistales bacterium]